MADMTPSAEERLRESEKMALRVRDEKQQDRPWSSPLEPYLNVFRVAAIETAYRDGKAAERAAILALIKRHIAINGALTEGRVVTALRALADAIEARQR